MPRITLLFRVDWSKTSFSFPSGKLVVFFMKGPLIFTNFLSVYAILVNLLSIIDYRR